MNGLSRGLLDTIQHLVGLGLVVAGALQKSLGQPCILAGMGLIGGTTLATLRRTAKQDATDE